MVCNLVNPVINKQLKFNPENLSKGCGLLMDSNNPEGYPTPRLHHSQANGTVPRPSSNIRQLVDPYAASMAGPPPAYNEHPGGLIGNGSAGGGSYNRDRESIGDFQSTPAHPPAPRSHPRDRGDSNNTHTSSRDLKRSASLEAAQPKILKVAVIGDSTVGKTCICQAATQDRYNFNKNYHLTCGVTVYSKGIKLMEETDEQVNLVLMDSSGKDIYTETLPKYWGKLDGVVLVVDMSSSSSLQNAGQWLHLAQKCMKLPSSSVPGDEGGSHKVTGILMANKTDIPPERRVAVSKQAEEFAAKNHLKYFECSVKDNSGLEEPFHYLAQVWAAGSLGLPNGGVSTSYYDDKENNPDSA